MKYKNIDYNLDVLFHRQKFLELHRKKLEDIIVEKKDYKEEFKHIQNIEQFKNLKQRTIQFNEREKQVQIQRENDILLTKLLDIQMKPVPKPQSRSLGAEYNVSSIKHHKNYVKMKNEIIGVIQKNDQIAKRIINQQSTIKHQEFEKDYEKSQYYKKIITRFNSNMQSENTLINLKGSEFHLNAFRKSQKYIQNSPSHFQVSPVRIRSSSPHKENQQEKRGSYSPQRLQTAQSQSSANQNQNATSSQFFNPVKTYKYNPNSSSNKSVLEKSQTQQSFFRATSPKSKNIRNELNNSNIVIKKVVSSKVNKNLNQSCLKGSKKQINIEIPAKKVIQILDEQSPVSPYVEVLVNKYLIQKEIEENKDQMQALVLNQKQNQSPKSNYNKKQSFNQDQQQQQQIATIECQKNIKKIVEEQKSQRQIMEQIVEEPPTVNSEHEISQKNEDDKQISQTSSRNLLKKEMDSDSQPNKSNQESQLTVKTFTEIRTFENNLDVNLENNLEYLDQQQQFQNKNQLNSKNQIDKYNQNNQRQTNFSNSYQTADFNTQNKQNESQQKSELSQITDAENSQIITKHSGIKVKTNKQIHHTAKSVGYDEKQNRWKKKQESEEYQNQEQIEYEEFNSYGIEGEQDEDAKEDQDEEEDENEYDDCDEDLEGNNYEQNDGNNLQSDIEENLIQDEENTLVKSEKLLSDSNNKKSKTIQSSKPNISRKNSSSFQVDDHNNYKIAQKNQRVGSLSQTSKNSKVQNSSEIQINQYNNSQPLLQQESDKNLKISNKQSEKDIQEEIEIE
ncbi:hypothetical protein TTHERM_00462890 (macronuclear) [Tetrahymena thermophila SB210]|uniref:Uncharacterized protein n=1 Tax=Tetrahymena thermophila (strain SB210) TaxID=312017 RepID=Q23PZ3_TETTS|nr:hypothetical protein TTHERM_00462890 [Tetrahymena thermophila SB210]EAR98542.2 hypothetical protein TTHERM_00462890 [Tetrahymena thermophila SB210]|eukprot:XP_001018787.2 hypothetical protein TTHERM_00462890 [Tetrahymena thermophila SB210]